MTGAGNGPARERTRVRIGGVVFTLLTLMSRRCGEPRGTELFTLLAHSPTGPCSWLETQTGMGLSVLKVMTPVRRDILPRMHARVNEGGVRT